MNENQDEDALILLTEAYGVATSIAVVVHPALRYL
jgi:hypothetical protein